MKFKFNIMITALFSFATIIAGTKEDAIEKKLALEAQKTIEIDGSIYRISETENIKVVDGSLHRISRTEDIKKSKTNIKYNKNDYPDLTREGGDTIEDAFVIEALPFNDTGETTGYTNDYDEQCPYTGSLSPDVVYSYTPDADMTIDVDLCDSDYDTKVYIYENDESVLSACNDDSCPGWMSELFDVALTAGNTYYIVVDGYLGDSGDYEILIVDSSEGYCGDAVCDDDETYESCPGDCQDLCVDDLEAIGDPEIEPNGDPFSDPAEYNSLEVGTVEMPTLITGLYDVEVVHTDCGPGCDEWTFTPDSDWFNFTLDEGTLLNLTVDVECGAIAAEITDGEGESLNLYSSEFGEGVSFTDLPLPAGDYYLSIRPANTNELAETRYNASLWGSDTDLIFGCINPNAPEYDPDANAYTEDSCWADCEGNIGYIGDGWCDSQNNNAACGFDLFDCCPTACAAYTADDCPSETNDFPDDCYLNCADGTCCGDCDDCEDPDSADNAVDGDCYIPGEGCMDETACNYDPEAINDDGSCLQNDCNMECGGPAVEDCNGDCDGTAVEDCNGDCDGTAVEDSCGTCDTDPENDCVLGCMDETACNYNLDATSDDGSCLQNDCNMECGGPAVEDCNGDCDGTAVVDCAGECGGTATADPCGTCDSDPENDCVLDCSSLIWYNDGWCDTGNNTPECDYDGGDCCPTDCYDNNDDYVQPETCDEHASCETCLDPNSPDLVGVCGPWETMVTGLMAEGIENDYDNDGEADFGVKWTWDVLLDGTSCEENGQVTCSDGNCYPSEEDCPEIAWEDCTGNTEWLGDGYCDSINNNVDCAYDLEDCCPTSCAANVELGCPNNPDGCYSTISCGVCETCEDPDSSDNVVDGNCDGVDGSCDACEVSYTDFGFDCCDTAWAQGGFTCDELENVHGWDCSGCACPGDIADPVCGDDVCNGDETEASCPEDCDGGGDGGYPNVPDDCDTNLSTGCPCPYDYPLMNGLIDCRDGSDGGSAWCSSAEDIANMLGDGWCDEGQWDPYVDLNCDYFDDDEGDCSNVECAGFGYGYQGCTVASGFACTWSEADCAASSPDGDVPWGACHASDGSDGGVPAGICDDGVGGAYECEANGLYSCCNGTCGGYTINDVQGEWTCGNWGLCSEDECDDFVQETFCDGGSAGGRTDSPDFKFMSVESSNNMKDGKTLKSPTIINVATGEIIPGTSNSSRSVSYFVNVTWTVDDVAFTETYETADTEYIFYSDNLDQQFCANVSGHSTELGVTEPTADVCSSPGSGSCPPGDVNETFTVDVLDIVNIVTYILTNVVDFDLACANMNGDYTDDGYDLVNVLDIVAIVAFILDEEGGSRVSDATTGKLIRNNGALMLEANGYIGGVQMTLSHDEYFSIELTDNAMIAEYNTVGNKTILVIVVPEDEELFTYTGDFEIVDMIVANSQDRVNVGAPTDFSLSAAYPNPFNPTTSLELSVPMNGQVTVQVYNLLGQVVTTLANGYMDASIYTLTWDASDVSSGMYIVKAEAAGTVSTQKLMLMK